MSVIEQTDGVLAVSRSLPRGSARLGLLRFRAHPWVPAALVAADILTLEFCLYLGFLARDWASDWFPIALHPPTYVGLSAGVLVLPLAYLLMGLYPGYGTNSVERVRRQSLATSIVFSSLIAWDYLAQGGIWSRGVLLATCVFALVLVPVATSWVRRFLVWSGFWGMPVMVVGSGKAGRELIETLNFDRKLGLVPVGIIDDDPAATGTTVAGVPVLGQIGRAGEFSRFVNTVVIAMPEAGAIKLVELSAFLPFPHVILLPDMTGFQSVWVTARDLGGILGLEIKKNLLIRSNRVLKSLLDYAICIPLFIYTLPLMVVSCAAIMTISPGSPIFIQSREGQHGRKIKVFKLRTMYRDAEARLETMLRHDVVAQQEWSRYFKLRRDPRILPYIGRLMRRSSLDEVPQLWNVLMNDMSLVGPRPFPDYHLERFGEVFRQLRRSVPPGLTGLWQVEARSDGDIALQEKLDSYYIRNWSLWLDLYIIVKTFAAVVEGKGAR